MTTPVTARSALLSWRSGHTVATSIAGILSAIIYFLVARLSHDGGIGVFEYLGAHFLLATVVLAFWYYLFLQGREIDYGPVILWAIVFRLIAVLGDPVLEDDHYRYLLDGCVFLEQGSPYGVPPASLFAANTLPEACQPLLSRVNNPEISTIYGPVLQVIFALGALLSAADINILQGVFAAVDIALVLLLCRFASARSVLLYAWCPLVLKEVAFTAHPDIVGIFLMMLAIHCRQSGQRASVAILLGTACAAKVFALLVAPFVLMRLALSHWLLFTAVLVAWYLPFIFAGESDLAVLGTFSAEWVFNASAFLVAANHLGDPVARLVCAALFAAWWSGYFVACYRRNPVFDVPRGEWIFGVFLLLSPVVNPWYTLWLLPFAVIRPNLWTWTLATMVPLTYITGLHYIDSGLSAYEISPWAYYTQVFVVAFALSVDRWRPVKTRLTARWRRARG